MLRRSPLRPPLAVSLAALALAAGVPSVASAQEEDEGFENLQVLADDITRDELMGIMRGFSFATGFRCSSCHVGEEGQPLSTYDFASDDRALKQKAREMLRMVDAINQQFLASLPDRSQPAVEVTCATCHGGARRPEPLGDLLARVASEEGAEAMEARYRELREAYFGRRAYDFSEGSLVDAAGQLAGAEREAEARAALALAAEFHPGSAQVAFATGQVMERLGDREAAIAAYRRLEALTGGG